MSKAKLFFFFFDWIQTDDGAVVARVSIWMALQLIGEARASARKQR